MKPTDEELTIEADWVLDRLSIWSVYQKEEKAGIAEDPFERKGEQQKFKYGKLI